MSKHTKGPWFINGNQRYTKYIEARIGGGMIQEVAACGPTEGHGEQEANTRLIAAAPELYESAVNAQKLLRTLYNETCDRLTKIVILERLNELDASIKKARAGA